MVSTQSCAGLSGSSPPEPPPPPLPPLPLLHAASSGSATSSGPTHLDRHKRDVTMAGSLYSPRDAVHPASALRDPARAPDRQGGAVRGDGRGLVPDRLAARRGRHERRLLR